MTPVEKTHQWPKASQTIWCMPRGAGKAEFESKLLVGKLKATEEKGFLFLHRGELVKNCDTERYLNAFGATADPDSLRLMQGNAVHAVADIETFGLEIYEIPEIRRYFQKLHERWPSWLAHADFSTPALRAVILAIAPNARIIRREKGRVIEATINRMWLLEFLRECIRPTLVLLHRTQTEIAGCFERLDKAVEYLNLR